MKGSILNITAAVIVILLCAGALFSEDKGGGRPVIKLYDKSPEYPFLKEVMDDGYFENAEVTAEYLPYNKNEIHRIEGNILYSELINIQGDEYALFTFYQKNGLDQTYKLMWKMPADDAADLLEEDPLPEIFRFVRQSEKSDVNKLIQNKAVSSKKYNNLKPMYASDGNGSRVQGYSFNLKSSYSAPHKFFRTLGWITLANGFGVANYWINKHENMEDWEYLPNQEGFKEKLTDGWAFDTNAFRTNTIYHIYAGMIYYQAGRACGYGYIGSTLWSFTGSLVWEYIGEFREQVSTNDMVFTPMGGAIMGEAFRHCGFYIEKTLPDIFIFDFVVFLLDPVRVLNGLIDRFSADEVNVELQFINPAEIIIQKSAMGKPVDGYYGGIVLRW